MKKRFTTLAILLILSLSFQVTSYAEFTDISAENTVLAEAVETLNEKGIVKGISDTEFGTYEKVTREQMAAFLYRLAHDGESLEGGENETAFIDLDDPTFYAVISWANQEGIIRGISETKFNPKASISLRDCYTMIVRMLCYEKDAPLSYPESYITIAESIGLSQNINNISYTDTLTRGDVAVILHNVLNKKSHPLDGKKIIFIGNSFTYYGRAVINADNIIDKEVVATRFADVGYFYQLCRQNGANVSVTNWTWGGHTLNDTFGGSCSANRGHDGYDHFADLKSFSDLYYDYVIIQPGSADTFDTVKGSIPQIQEIFKAVNPDVKFIYNFHSRYYLRNNENDKVMIANLDELAKELNLEVANWGALLNDMINGTAVVENTTFDYNKNTFIVSKSASDGYHPNMLTGYITAQMVYSMMTGEKALGQDYSFCTNVDLNKDFNVQPFLNAFYKYDNISPADSETKLVGDELTNFPEIFKSPADMAGIQKLIDEYVNND